jgi:predicted RNase H-like HicB family nuclease
MASYIGVLHKDADSDFGVSFPDFSGCVTAGSTLDEAARMAQEALAGHVAVCAEYGEDIPAPMSLEQAQEHEFAAGALAFIVVRLPEIKGRVVRVNITLREEALRRIDEAARANRQSRSSYMVSRTLGA